MPRPRVLLALVLSVAVAVIVGLGAVPTGASGAAPEVRPRPARPDDSATPDARLRAATGAARSLGLARANFLEGDDPAPDPSAEDRSLLSRDEKAVAEKFARGNLSRIGNTAVFASPDATPEPARPESPQEDR